jgi:hypothetical protein
VVIGRDDKEVVIGRDDREMVVGRDGDVDFTNLRFCLVTCRKVVPKS